MKKGCLISLVLFVLICVGLCYGMLHAFDTEYSNATIPQKIGGKLICDAEYNADIHNWQYNVNYKYKDKTGRVFNIGSGEYFVREWEKNEQLQTFDKWVILKTGGYNYNDKVIIGNFKDNVWNDYDFSPEVIQKDSVWIKSKIHSLVNWLPEEVYITEINNGKIELLYKFRIDEKNTDLLGEKKIVYKIEAITGKPVMIKIMDTK